MADGEEKSFAASPKRREEARKKGQVARSAEFGAAATLLAVVAALHILLPGDAGLSLIRDLQSAFEFNPHAGNFTIESVHQWQIVGLEWGGKILLPVAALAVVLALVSGIGQVGFAVTPEALNPKWERLNPGKGIKRLLSMHGTVEALKGLVKMGLVAGICFSSLRGGIQSGELLDTMREPLPETMAVVGSLLWTMGLRVSVALFIMAVADYAYQKYDFEKGLKMSMSEVKQENKQSDGDPLIKAKIRRLQREMSKRRMMADVPKADVIVTNPTHFAVALRYERGTSAPKVVAKGQDEMAATIREIAREHKVPLVENKPLARTLYATVDIGRDIPPDLFEAVAQVLAFVYRTHGRRK
ncbi:MAG: flagellar biosynthesis protein FlhB [Janthinobacterium lividum]